MARQQNKETPGWSDVKAKLQQLDDAGLRSLLHDLYASSKENKAFLHARFGLGIDTLAPYKETITRWVWPDVSRGQDVSVSKAKKAITDYKKAVGQPEGVADLMVFYCEQAAGFSMDAGFSDDRFFSSLITMFDQSLKLAASLLASQRDVFLGRLKEVARISQHFGYGVGDEMDFLLNEYRRGE